MCLLPALAQAAPLTLHHQARLTGVDGAPFNGDHKVEISLWDDQTDTTAGLHRLWHGTFTAVPLEDGYFSLELGLDDQNQAVDSAWFSDDVWLQTDVNDVPLLPRTKVADVPGAGGGTVISNGSGGFADTSANRPSSGTEGLIWFNKALHLMEVYTGGEWVIVDHIPEPGVGCRALLDAGFTTSGTYNIVGTGGEQSVYCDQVTDGGGWTRVFLADNNNYNAIDTSYFDGLSGGSSLISESYEMMLAFTNPSTGVLTNAWSFPTPMSVHSLSPLAVEACHYVVTDVKQISSGTVHDSMTIRMGHGSFGTQCDQSCSGTYGQICLKSNSIEGSPGGFSDFPHYNRFANTGADNCSESSQSYNATACSNTRRFAVFVR